MTKGASSLFCFPYVANCRLMVAMATSHISALLPAGHEILKSRLRSVGTQCEGQWGVRTFCKALWINAWFLLHFISVSFFKFLWRCLKTINDFRFFFPFCPRTFCKRVKAKDEGRESVFVLKERPISSICRLNKFIRYSPAAGCEAALYPKWWRMFSFKVFAQWVGLCNIWMQQNHKKCSIVLHIHANKHGFGDICTHYI